MLEIKTYVLKCAFKKLSILSLFDSMAFVIPCFGKVLLRAKGCLCCADEYLSKLGSRRRGNKEPW
jgi:hypothetical protein